MSSPLVKLSIISILFLIAMGAMIWAEKIFHSHLLVTHLFYLSVILSALWWGLRGLLVLIPLAVTYVVLHVPISAKLYVDENFIECSVRFSIIALVGCLVAFFSDWLAKERTKSEQLAQIVKDATTGIIGVDLNGTIQSWNSAAELIYGYEEREALGQQMSFFAENQSKFDLKNSLEQIKQGSSLIQIETTHISKVGQKIDISMMMYPSISYVTNTLTGAAIYVRDISKEKAFKKHLVLADRLTSIGMLASSVAHEVRNPLVVADGVIKLIKSNLKDLPQDSQVPSLVELLSRSLLRIREIAEGLTAYSGCHNKSEQIVDMHVEIDEAAGLLKHFMAQRRVKLDTSLISQDSKLMCVPGKMQQIVVNLVMNAIQALNDREDGEVKIETGDEEGFFILRVSDNGCGISEKNLDHLFEPFFTTKSQETGTGLGLHIVNFIVDSFGGKIEVKTKINCGTTFTITLPHDRTLKKVPALKKEKDTASSPPISHSMRPLKGHFLLVEDDPDIRFVVNKFLVEFGLTVDLAENGRDGLNKIQNQKYSCIITDLKMPEMDGCEMIAEIRNKVLQPEAKIFVMTGYMNSIPCHRRSFIKSNIDGIILKPFSKNELYEKLSSVLKDEQVNT